MTRSHKAGAIPALVAAVAVAVSGCGATASPSAAPTAGSPLTSIASATVPATEICRAFSCVANAVERHRGNPRRDPLLQPSR